MSTKYHVSYNVPSRPDLKRDIIEVSESYDLPCSISAKVAEQIESHLGYEVGVQLCSKLGSPLTIRRHDVELDEVTDKVGTVTVTP